MKNKIIAVAAIAALVLVAIIGFNAMPASTYALISIDINPSLQIEIDEDYKVIHIELLNEDANQIYSEDMIGQDVHDVIKQLVHNAELGEFLNDVNNNILISSAIVDEKAALDDIKLQEFGEDLEAFLSHDMKVPENVHIIYIESDDETAAQSEAEGITLGRLELAKITEDDQAKVEPVSQTLLSVQDTDMEAYEIADEEDLADSIMKFASKLQVAVDNGAFMDSNSDQLNDYEVWLANLPEYPYSDLTDEELIVLLREVKDFWKPIMKEYQKTWAMTQEDDDQDEDQDEEAIEEEHDDQELIGSIDEFQNKLSLMWQAHQEQTTAAATTVEVDATTSASVQAEESKKAVPDDWTPVKEWLDIYNGLNELYPNGIESMTHEQLLAYKNQGRDLYNLYKTGYQYLWSDEDEDDADEEDHEDGDEHFSDGDLKDLREWLEKLSNVDGNVALDEWFANNNALITKVLSEDAIFTEEELPLLKDLKASAKVFFMDLKEQFKGNDDEDEDDLKATQDDDDDHDDDKDEDRDKDKGRNNRDDDDDHDEDEDDEDND